MFMGSTLPRQSHYRNVKKTAFSTVVFTVQENTQSLATRLQLKYNQSELN